MERILVIRHGALGDLFLCMKPFQDIRAAHPEAHITLLVAPEFAGFIGLMPWFDGAITDSRPSILRPDKLIGLGAKLAGKHFTKIYDLQNKPRSALYRKTFLAGVAASFRAKAGKGAEKIHRQEEYLRQLRAANVPDSGELKLDWLSAKLDGLSLPANYAVLIPGCSPHLPHKRWAPERYAALARALHAKGTAVVLAGTKADADAIAEIKKNAEFVVDLSGKTSLPQLASVLRGAKLAVGNDTGPTFLSAMLGTPTLTIMSHHTDPVLSGPIGPRCAFVKREDLHDLPVEDVVEALRHLLV